MRQMHVQTDEGQIRRLYGRFVWRSQTSRRLTIIPGNVLEKLKLFLPRPAARSVICALLIPPGSLSLVSKSKRIRTMSSSTPAEETWWQW